MVLKKLIKYNYKREKERERESERNDVFFCNIVRYIFDGFTQRHINHILKYRLKYIVKYGRIGTNAHNIGLIVKHTIQWK